MHLGDKAKQEGTPEGLTTIGTSRDCPYRAPMPCGTTCASADNFTTWRRIWDPTFKDTTTHKNLTSGRDLEQELADGTTIAATQIIEGQGISIRHHRSSTATSPSLSFRLLNCMQPLDIARICEKNHVRIRASIVDESRSTNNMDTNSDTKWYKNSDTKTDTNFAQHLYHLSLVR
jgi:hypothetical protein